MKSKRRSTNEMEFQGEVITWLNENISKHSGMGLDRATQEKPRERGARKRNDLVVWKSRPGEIAFLTFELKTPDTPISDPVFLTDAVEKARHWHSPYFAIWNMREAELYPTPASGHPTPADRLSRWDASTGANQLEDWLKPDIAKRLKRQLEEMLDKAWDHSVRSEDSGVTIDPEIFVTRISTTLHQLRALLDHQIKEATKSSRQLRSTINKIATEQGFKGFVEDVDYAIAGQMGYRLIGQILFYFALRRKQLTLRPITLSSDDKIPTALYDYWNDVRRFDYEALFRALPHI